MLISLVVSRFSQSTILIIRHDFDKFGNFPQSVILIIKSILVIDYLKICNYNRIK